MPASVARVEIFTGKNGQNIDKWIDDVEVCSRLEQVRETNRFDFAIQFLSDPVVKCVKSLTAPLEKISGRTWEWDWIKLKTALRGIDKQTKKYTPDKKGRRWLKLAALGALVGATGPLALSLSATAAAACAIGGSFVAIRSPNVIAEMRAEDIVAEANGQSPSMFESKMAIWNIGAKSPSYNWEDAEQFWPSVELVSELLELLVPNKNLH